MNTARSDAATSTDDIVKGRPLCLFYFAHPFGVLSCEPPTVLAPPGEAPPPPAAPPAMARRSPVWPPPPACSRPRRLPLYTRTLPPLRLPTPRDLSSLDGSENVWPRSPLLPPDKLSLPPIELPLPAEPALLVAAASPAPAPVRVRRPGPVGVRKGGARSRGAHLARLLRRAVATGVAGVDLERPARGVRGVVSTVRAAWQPPPRPASSASSAATPPPAPPPPCCSSWPSPPPSTSSTAWSRRPRTSMRPRAVAVAPAVARVSPPLPHRRYSLPETVMRRYRVSCEQSEAEDESCPASGVPCAARELVRRSALQRRMGLPAASPAPCRCDTHSLDGSRSGGLPTLPSRGMCSPQMSFEPSADEALPVATRNGVRLEPSSSADILEIVVSATTPATPFRAARSPMSRSTDCNLNIDEYVSNILVDSLNSLSDRLESMTVSIGGADGRISVVEKEIKVKLQNKGVNTVVHLSPTSNNQIIFGNKELCEREMLNDPPPPVKTIFCEELDAGVESGWHAPPRSASPCASLVDSLDDPMSPRAAPPPPPHPPPPLPPASHSQTSPDMECTPHKERCESFFIRMNEDTCACEKENIVVADHMPEKIKQRLYRRHRRREMRAQGVRRGAARRNAQRDMQRQCAALVDALIDDAIARVAREEYRYARIARKRECNSSNGDALRTRMTNGRTNNTKGAIESRTREEPTRVIRLTPSSASPPPLGGAQESGPRRVYHKSEIHDGGKCIEILEIVEFVNTSRSSSETNSDENLTGVKCRRSRIPVPIQDKGDLLRVRRPSAVSSVSPLIATTPVNAMPRRTSVPGVEPSVPPRFERLFDVIPEERSSLSLESTSEETPVQARVSATPSVVEVPVSMPVPAGRRSAATSPLAPPGSSSSVERMTRRNDCNGQPRRSIGIATATATQWACAPSQSQSTHNSLENTRAKESTKPKQVERSSSECESESVAEAQSRACAREGPRRRGRGRGRGRAAVRPRRRALHAAPAPAPAPPHAVAPRLNAQSTTSETEPARAAESEGWSLTLAGSCRAALPSRLDLRLRFLPPHGAAPQPPQPPHTAHTDRYTDTPSQGREWVTSKHPSVMPCAHAAPAIHYDLSKEYCGERRTLCRRNCAHNHTPPTPTPDALPALAPPPSATSHTQARTACCRCCAPGGGGSRAHAHPPPRTDQRTSLDTLEHATLLTAKDKKRGWSRGAQAGRTDEAGAALAVLGCAIVPERRAAPPTASQRDLMRTRRPRPRRHSLTAAATAAAACLRTIHSPPTCHCYAGSF